MVRHIGVRISRRVESFRECHSGDVIQSVVSNMKPYNALQCSLVWAGNVSGRMDGRLY